MTITADEIRKAIDALRKHNDAKFHEEGLEKNFTLLVNPKAYFVMYVEQELCMKAMAINNGKDIFDKRTKGWKMIKDKFELFTY